MPCRCASNHASIFALRRLRPPLPARSHSVSLSRKSGITSPMTKLGERMMHLADGETDSDVPGLERKDEIGQMAGAIAVFRSGASSASGSRQGRGQSQPLGNGTPRAGGSAKQGSDGIRATAESSRMACHRFLTVICLPDRCAVCRASRRVARRLQHIPSEKLNRRASCASEPMRGDRRWCERDSRMRPTIYRNARNSRPRRSKKQPPRLSRSPRPSRTLPARTGGEPAGRPHPCRC